MLLRDYLPYNKNQLKIKYLDDCSPANKKELENMNKRVNEILKQYTVDKYFNNEFYKLISYIENIFKSSNLSFKGKVLEFGAGICKSSAVISKYKDISEVHCLDFSKSLLTEIAPRVIHKIGGDLSKFTFYIGDMNILDNIDGVYDFIICYGTVHHLILPEYFFQVIYSKLKDNGKILCMREPALPKFIIPTKSFKHWQSKMYQKRLSGDNENEYTLPQYKKITGDKYNFKYIQSPNNNIFKKLIINKIFPIISPLPFQINFLLEKK